MALRSRFFCSLKDGNATDHRHLCPSNEVSTFQNWAVGEPNGGTYENFAVIYPGTTKYGVAGVWNDVYIYPHLVSQGIAEIPLNLSITTSSTPAEGAGVFTTSINLSAGTETSGNLAEGAEVYWSVSGVTADALESW